jgi:hypothetical protein
VHFSRGKRHESPRCSLRPGRPGRECGQVRSCVGQSLIYGYAS